MFERYNEKARRVVFYARYFASEQGASYIEPGHILLGILQEDPELFAPWLKSEDSLESLRREVRGDVRGPKRDTSVDMALSKEAKRVLTHGAEEAERLAHSQIKPSHLLFGILRERKSPAAAVLRKHGVDLRQARLVFVASSNGQSTVMAESEDLHKLVDRLPRSEMGRARALLQALLEANRPVAGSDGFAAAEKDLPD